jgi:ATP-dependent Clp protease adaptor protein ClpS
LKSRFPSIMKTSEKEKPQVDVMEVVETTDVRDLVVFNDHINTFEHVIATLIRVCQHSPEQAEQCTWIIHHKGKCTVKSGEFEELQPLKQAICEVGIDAKIL